MKRHSLIFSLLTASGACLAVGCARGDAESAATLARADALVSEQKYSDAINEAQSVLNRDAKSPHANRLAGVAYLELGQLAHAYHYLLIAQAAAPDRAEVRIDLARVYLISGNTTGAREHAYTILDADSLNVAACVLLGASATTPAEVDEAIHRLEAARSRFGNDAGPRLALASLYQRKSDPTTAAEFFKQAIAADPRSPEAHALLGAFHAAQGNAPLAIEETKTALGMAPPGSQAAARVAASYLLYGQREQAKGALATVAKDASAAGTSARRMLAEIALADGNSALAEEMFSPILQKDSADGDALVQLGRARIREQRLDDATEALRRAIAMEPRLAPLHYHLGVALAERGNVAEAQAQFDTAITLTRNYPEAVTRLAALNVRADIARASIGDAERQVKLNPRSLESRRVLGESLIGAKRADEADEVFRDAAKRMPDRPEPHYWLGVSLFKQGKKADARNELERALKMSPSLEEVMSQLVAIDLSENRSDSALVRVTRQLQLAPQSAALYDLLGVIREARNESEAAEAAFLKSAQLDPNLVDPHVQLANFYVARQKFDLAVAHGEQARELDSRNVAALVALGVAYQATGDVGKARQAYERALTVDPNSAAAANNLAYLFSEAQTNQADALRYALVALRIAPNDPHINDTAGWILYKAGRYAQALALLQESAKRLPSAPEVQYHFGMAAQKMGDTATARKALALAVGASINFPGKDDARKALALLR